jgi:hypothetical protein
VISSVLGEKEGDKSHARAPGPTHPEDRDAVAGLPRVGGCRAPRQELASAAGNVLKPLFDGGPIGRRRCRQRSHDRAADGRPASAGGVSAAPGVDASECLERRYQPFRPMTDRRPATYGQSMMTCRRNTNSTNESRTTVTSAGGHVPSLQDAPSGPPTPGPGWEHRLAPADGLCADAMWLERGGVS